MKNGKYYIELYDKINVKLYVYKNREKGEKVYEKEKRSNAIVNGFKRVYAVRSCGSY